MAISNPAKAVGLGDGVENHHEGGGWAGDAEPAAAGQGNDKAGDNRGIQPVLRRHATGDGQRHGQWDGNDAHGNAGHQVTQQTPAPVTLIQAGFANGVSQPKRKQMGAVRHSGLFC